MFAFGIMNNENMTGIFDGMEDAVTRQKKPVKIETSVRKLKAILFGDSFWNDSGKIFIHFFYGK